MPSIGSATFRGCTTITSITILNGVTSIGSGAFCGCTSLTSITIPTSVTNIGLGAFADCGNLMSITVESGNKVYHSAGNCLIETESKTLIAGCKNSTIPTDGSVTSIGDYAFYDCDGLTDIAIPDSVTSIGYAAFYDCDNLTSVTFDENSPLTSIGDFAYNSCDKLTNITLGKNNQLIRIGASAFSSCTKLTTITFGGTMEHWKNVNKGDYWNNGRTTIAVNCTDGTTIETNTAYVISSSTSIKKP